MTIPITNGQGQSSVATELVSNLHYQRIEVMGQGGSSVLAVNPDGSLNASIIGSPAFTLTGSVISLNTGSIIAVSQGSVITVWQNSSILAVPVGSVVTVLQSSSIIGVVTGSVVAIPTGNQSVSGAVNVSGSVLLGDSNASVITVWQNSSVITVNSGSVVAVPVGSVITVWQNSSVLAVPVGSVVTVWQTPSIVGTYQEDVPHAAVDRGLFTLAVRNDNLASFVGTDRDYTPIAVGPVGETISANAPITKWVRGTADLRVVQGASVTAIAAQGASIFTYITGVQLANMGSASVLVTFTGGLGSILGYSIAPAGGGSNIYYPNALKTGENSAFAASISGTASVLVSAQGFIAKI